MLYDEPALLVGAVLSKHYRLVRVLGEGGLAVVYEAEPVSGGPPVAIKILRGEFLSEPEVITRFLSEPLVSQRIADPGVARVFEAARAEDGSPYLVMEFVNGEPLTRSLNRGRIPVEHAAPIAHELLMTLASVHAAGVVHRDLKPDNIFLVRSQTGPVRVKVLDLGIAQVIDHAGGGARKTRTGMLLGTPGYMSPEQVENSKAVDHRSDLWAVSVLFYEMLTGTTAFVAENQFAKLTAVLQGSPRPIAEVSPQYAHWGPFFERGFSRTKEDRFQSAQEMALSLRSVAQSGQLPLPSVRFDGLPESALGSALSVAGTRALGYATTESEAVPLYSGRGGTQKLSAVPDPPHSAANNALGTAGTPYAPARAENSPSEGPGLVGVSASIAPSQSKTGMAAIWIALLSLLCFVLGAFVGGYLW